MDVKMNFKLKDYIYTPKMYKSDTSEQIILEVSELTIRPGLTLFWDQKIQKLQIDPSKVPSLTEQNYKDINYILKELFDVLPPLMTKQY